MIIEDGRGGMLRRAGRKGKASLVEVRRRIYEGLAVVFGGWKKFTFLIFLFFLVPRVPNSATSHVLNRRPTGQSRMEEETRLDRNIWSGQVQSSRGPV